VRTAFWILAGAFALAPVLLLVLTRAADLSKGLGLVLGAAVLVTLSVRAATMRVVLLEDRLIVRGVLQTRTIDRTAVLGVSRRRWLEWADAAGRHLTPLPVLWTFGPVPAVFQRHVDAAARAIEGWILRVE